MNKRFSSNIKDMEWMVMKKIISLFISVMFSMLLFYGYVQADYEDDIIIQMNHKVVNFEPRPFLRENCLLVPVRKIAEKMGAMVLWAGHTNEVTITKGADVITFCVGQKIVYKNKDPFNLDVSTELIGEYTYVPIQFFVEAMGASVSFDKGNQTLMIEYSVSYGNSSGNLVTAFGDVAKCEDYIYFSSHYAKGLWKYNVQTGEKTLLLPYTANYINIVDGWIYCLLSDSQHKKLGLYRLKTDGTELKMLTDMDLTQINVVNHKIYGIAWNGGYPYCLNLDGSELTKLSDYGFEDLNVTEHYLYM